MNERRANGRVGKRVKERERESERAKKMEATMFTGFSNKNKSVVPI